MNLCGIKLCLSLVGLQVVWILPKQNSFGDGGSSTHPTPFVLKPTFGTQVSDGPIAVHMPVCFPGNQSQSFTREQFLPNIPQKNMSMFSCQFLPAPLSQVAVMQLWSFQISQKNNDRGVGLMTRSLQKSPTEPALAQHHQAVSAEAGSTLSSSSDIWDPFHETPSAARTLQTSLSHSRVPGSRVFALCSGTFHHYC